MVWSRALMKKGQLVPGPPPLDIAQRRRRNAPLANTRKLPAEGRAGPPPCWPLETLSEAESAVWAEIWSTPQATEWERLAWPHPVARYVRCLVASEQYGAKAALLAEVRLLEQQLGLTPMAMLRLRWEVVDDLPAGPLAGVAAKPRRRLLIVDDPDGDG
jgi:hypothetical protein